MEAICHRVIDAQREDGESFELEVVMYKPFPDPREGGDWACSFHIRGLEEEMQGVAYGIDEFQALLHCIKSIDAHLKSLQRTQHLSLSFLGLQDLGFHTNLLGA